MIWVLIGIYLIIIYLEVPGLVKQGMYKELVVFSLVFVLGIYLTLSQFYGWPLINPFEPWIKALQP